MRVSISLATAARLVLAAATLLLAIGGGRAGDVPPVVRSAKSGPWSAPAAWEGGAVPGERARVLVRTGHRVVYDVNADVSIRSINVAGTLTFDPERDTKLVVGLVVIRPGDAYCESGFDCEAHATPPDAKAARPALEVGTPGRPIGAKHTALIRLMWDQSLDRDSCPALVCCGGRMDFHGTPLPRTWVRLGAEAKKGDRTITLAEEVPGWRVGDHVIVTATKRTGPAEEPTEERTITAIDGVKLRLDKALRYPHLGEGDRRGEVANLSRNVVVESADPEGARGHTMYHSHSAGAISYAEFRDLGKKGVLGRYSLHYHLCGDTMRGSYVLGASVHDSENRFLAVHGTSYLVVRDCVGYKSIGYGFFLEDGTEVFNVFDRNLAACVRTGHPLPQQALRIDGNNGAGFWWANGRNTFTRNVAADCENDFHMHHMAADWFKPPRFRVQQPDGTFRDDDLRTLPLVRFEGNEAHAVQGWGVRFDSTSLSGEASHSDGTPRFADKRKPFHLRDVRVWDVGSGALWSRVAVLRTEGLHFDESEFSDEESANVKRYRPEMIDDLPPTTVITHVTRAKGRAVVRGTTADNGVVRCVVVNGKEARPAGSNFAEWEVTLDGVPPGPLLLKAHAEDEAKNVEPRPHAVTVAE
jgi:hypothetical protein